MSDSYEPVNKIEATQCSQCPAIFEVAVPRAAYRVQVQNRPYDSFEDGYWTVCPGCSNRVWIHYWD